MVRRGPSVVPTTWINDMRLGWHSWVRVGVGLAVGAVVVVGWCLEPNVHAQISSSSPRAPAVPKAKPAVDPLEVRADHLRLDLEHKMAWLEGNVELKRGELVIQAPKVQVRYDPSPNVVWAKAFGPVHASYRDWKARSGELELDWKKQKVELNHGVTLYQQGSQLQASRAQFDLRTKQISMDSVKGRLTGSTLSGWQKAK
jgi:lipopolysaccharide export system protein LptA